MKSGFKIDDIVEVTTSRKDDKFYGVVVQTPLTPFDKQEFIIKTSYGMCIALDIYSRSTYRKMGRVVKWKI